MSPDDQRALIESAAVAAAEVSRSLAKTAEQLRWRYGVGSGVVYDSRVAAEWAELAVKLRALLPGSAEAYVLEQTVAIESGADALDAALRRALEERAG